MITQEERRVEEVLIPFAVTCYVSNITKVLECCQILEWKNDLSIRANYMVLVTNESYIKMSTT
jgi:hypothetical protein